VPIETYKRLRQMKSSLEKFVDDEKERLKKKTDVATERT
jgi:hypothetical protein